MVDSSAWSPGDSSQKDEGRREISSEQIPSNYLDKVEDVQEAVKRKNTISSDDGEAFMLKVKEDAHKGRSTILLNGSTTPSHNRNGDAEKVKNFLEEVIEDRTAYRSFEGFVEETRAVLASGEFKKASLKHPERGFSPRIEEKVEIIAEFLEKYGDEDEYLGKTHYSFVLDDPERTNSWDADKEITEYRFVMQGVGVDINRLYANGAIGKQGTGSYGPTEISMRKDLVDRYG